MHILKYLVTSEDDGRMLKRVARSSMNMSAHLLASAKASGSITVNGEKRNADRPVFAGEYIEVCLEDNGTELDYDETPLNAVYIDDDIIIVDKPAPLPSISSPKQPSNTLENRMAYMFRNESGYVYRPVNRLDKGTSGLMVVARHAHSQNVLQEKLHSDDFVREYYAVAEGTITPEKGKIDLPIGKAEGATVKRTIDRVNGKPSVTLYENVKTGNGRTLVKLRLLTGRTHQIRVHLSAIGHPVTGDFLYGKETDELPGRFALHSYFLELTHPITGERMKFESPLPDELRRLTE